MTDKALIVIDIQNDITKNYKEIIGNINAAIDWSVAHDIPVVYIKHNNLSAGTRTFKPDKQTVKQAKCHAKWRQVFKCKFVLLVFSLRLCYYFINKTGEN